MGKLSCILGLIIMKDKIKAARIAAGWSQPTLAKRAGVSKQTISNLERGRHNPSIDTLKKVCGALSMDWRELV